MRTVCNGSRESCSLQREMLRLTVSMKQDAFKQKEKRATLRSAHGRCKAEGLLLSSMKQMSLVRGKIVT